MVKNLPVNAGDRGSIPGLRRSPGEENGNPVQCSAWEIPWTKEPVGLHSMESQSQTMTWQLNSPNNNPFLELATVDSIPSTPRCFRKSSIGNFALYLVNRIIYFSQYFCVYGFSCFDLGAVLSCKTHSSVSGGLYSSHDLGWRIVSGI